MIGPNGDNLGEVSIEEANHIAREANLDLVEVAPNANPPVCRVMNYGKFLYERTKKERESRKSQTRIEIKELRLRVKMDPHDREYRVKDAKKWLEAGMKVKVNVPFRGREITYPELALKQLEAVLAELGDNVTIEQPPTLEGRAMSMLLATAHKTKK